MTIQDWLTVAALLLNIGALIYAGIQTKLARESLDAARVSIDEDKKVRQLEALPKSDSIISVDVQLQMMQDHLQKTINKLKEYLVSKKATILSEISERGVSGPERIIDRRTYQYAPDWLKEMLMCGAQYHYNAICLEEGLKKYVEETQRDGMVHAMLDRYRDSLNSIEEIRGYIKNRVPDFYLRSPASISEKKFLSPIEE